jgi:hypothetical protein
MASDPVRPCIGCGQSDDHPRHVVDNGTGNDALWHPDCHARSANGCEVCEAQIAGVPSGTVGDELRAHLVTTGSSADQPGWTSPDEAVTRG